MELAILVDVHLLLPLPTRVVVRYSGKYYHHSLERP